MSGVIRGGSAAFVPRARLIKLLGGELIRDEVMAVTELVKNAHDADATRVRLTFQGVSGEHGEILIEDNGRGMDADQLLGSWMQPAGSIKLRRNQHYTPLGRRSLGEKGVGRFAVDRLGRHAELVSRTAGRDIEIVALFDWDQFDDETRLLSDISIRWYERRAKLFDRSGTRIRITSLRMPWKEGFFRRLCARLQRLLSPVAGDIGFEINIVSDEFPDYSGLVKLSFLDRSPYSIVADYDGGERIRYQLGAAAPERLLSPGTNITACGPVKITVHGFDLESEALARVGPSQEVRAWLREWSGISIYRDGFRVLPYGEPDDDWLRLDQRRVNTPMVRFSNNQICGFVEISRDANPELRDQTNRGGLILNRAHDDLRHLVLFVLQFLEADRQVKRGAARLEAETVQKRHSERYNTDQLVTTLRGSTRRIKNGQTRLRDLVGQLERGVATERAAYDAEASSLLQLAAMGEGARFAPHAIQHRIRLLRQLVRAFGSSSDRAVTTKQIGEAERVLDELEAAAEMLGAIAPSRRVHHGVLDLVVELKRFKTAVSSLLGSVGASCDVTIRGTRLARTDMPRATFHQLLHVLMWNSLEAFGEGSRKQIRLRLRKGPKRFWVISFEDTGAGISPELREKVFEPGFSTRSNRLGMGLAIARRLVEEAGGRLGCRSTRSRLKGARFELILPVKRSRTTLA